MSAATRGTRVYHVICNKLVNTPLLHLQKSLMLPARKPLGENSNSRSETRTLRARSWLSVGSSPYPWPPSTCHLQVQRWCVVPPSLVLHGHAMLLLAFWAGCQALPVQGFCTGVLLGGSEAILDSVVDFRSPSLPRLRGFQGAVPPPPGL